MDRRTNACVPNLVGSKDKDKDNKDKAKDENDDDGGPTQHW